MNRAKIPLLGYALLGLLHEAPFSGYGVRKMLPTHPWEVSAIVQEQFIPRYSGWKKAGLIRGRVEDGF